MATGVSRSRWLVPIRKLEVVCLRDTTVKDPYDRVFKNPDLISPEGVLGNRVNALGLCVHGCVRVCVS